MGRGRRPPRRAPGRVRGLRRPWGDDGRPRSPPPSDDSSPPWRPNPPGSSPSPDEPVSKPTCQNPSVKAIILAGPTPSLPGVPSAVSHQLSDHRSPTADCTLGDTRAPYRGRLKRSSVLGVRYSVLGTCARSEFPALGQPHGEPQ